MKMTSQGQRQFLKDAAQQLATKGLNLSGLARTSGVHQSQVSRILAGKFRTISSNVMQICITLGLKVDDYVVPSGPSSADRERVLSAALSAWDGTSEDARALASLLNQLSAFRR